MYDAAVVACYVAILVEAMCSLKHLPFIDDVRSPNDVRIGQRRSIASVIVYLWRAICQMIYAVAADIHSYNDP